MAEVYEFCHAIYLKKREKYEWTVKCEKTPNIETYLKLSYQQPILIKRIHLSVFFLYRPAGKTFLYATLLHTIHRKSDLVTPVASTRSAATLFRCRRTAHSGFKIPILMNATSTCNIKPNSKKAQILLKTKLIIWDEAPMTHSHAFVAVSRLLCDITKYQKPFGGKIILFGGNFLQVLQVIL